QEPGRSHLPGPGKRHRASPRHAPSVVDNLDVICVAVLETKDDTPGTIDRDRPESLPVTLQLMQPNALQRRYRRELRCGVQFREALEGAFHIQTGERRAAFGHELPRGGSLDRSDHTESVLRQW